MYVMDSGFRAMTTDTASDKIIYEERGVSSTMTFALILQFVFYPTISKYAHYIITLTHKIESIYISLSFS